MFLTNKAFWADAIERAIKTAAQTAVALFGTDQLGILDIDWTQVGSAAALAAVISLFTSIGSGGVGTQNTAGVTKSAAPVKVEESSFTAREETFGS